MPRASDFRVPVSPALLLAFVALGCGEVQSLRDSLSARTPHQRYAEALRQAGLDSTALGRDWLAAAERSLARALPATLPLREAGYFSHEEAGAVAYRVSLRRGQRLVVQVETQGPPLRIFLDVFEVPRDSGRARDRVSSAEDDARRVELEAPRDGAYLVRLQPELLRSVRYLLTATVEPTLAFPVAGRGSQSIQSFFGADRDAGRRQHHGVDIFAPRGTAVLAAADGFVRSVGTNRLGGRVIWLSDTRRGQSLYYAHLDSQLVRAGTYVRVGDTLGLVGNTGNARTTAPHLHFGIYRRGEGPLDPFPFLYRPPGEPARFGADTGRIGDLARVVHRAATVRASADPDAVSLGVLPRHSVLRVEGVSGAWYRVRLPDTTLGYVVASALADVESVVRRERAARAALVRDQPVAGGAVVDSLSPGAEVTVLGRFADYLYVRTPGGVTGWLGDWRDGR